MPKQRDEAIETHPPVICDYNHPPPDPQTGARFGILDRPGGAWAAHKNGVAEWDGRRWVFTDPQEGMVVYNEQEGRAYRYTRGDWHGLDE